MVGGSTVARALLLSISKKQHLPSSICTIEKFFVCVFFSLLFPFVSVSTTTPQAFMNSELQLTSYCFRWLFTSILGCKIQCRPNQCELLCRCKKEKEKKKKNRAVQSNCFLTPLSLSQPNCNHTIVLIIVSGEKHWLTVMATLTDPHSSIQIQVTCRPGTPGSVLYDVLMLSWQVSKIAVLCHSRHIRNHQKRRNKPQQSGTFSCSLWKCRALRLPFYFIIFPFFLLSDTKCRKLRWVNIRKQYGGYVGKVMGFAWNGKEICVATRMSCFHHCQSELVPSNACDYCGVVSHQRALIVPFLTEARC